MGIAYFLLSILSRQGEGQPEGEQTVICFEGAKSVVALGYCLDAEATVTMPLSVRNRQVIPDDHFRSEEHTSELQSR